MVISVLLGHTLAPPLTEQHWFRRIDATMANKNGNPLRLSDLAAAE